MPGTSIKQDDAASDAKSEIEGPKVSKQDDESKINSDKTKVDANQNDEAKQQKPENRSVSTQQRRTIATSTSLFVTGFANAINKTHVERLFSKFGRTERISDFMTSQKATSNSRYCFVEYDSIESAQKAMDNLNGRTLLHKRLVVLPAHANTDDNSSSRKTAAVSMNPEKERILLDQKIAALKAKLKKSQGD